MDPRNITLGELITYCSLRGDIKTHAQVTDNNGHLTDFWFIRLEYQSNLLVFQYHKDPETEKLTFIEGKLNIKDPVLGTEIAEIHGFRHLLESIMT